MAAITLKNIPDDLLEALRDSAVSEHRSLNQQALYLLAQALHTRREQGSGEPEQSRKQLAAWRAVAGKWRSDQSAVAETRGLYRARARGRKVEL